MLEEDELSKENSDFSPDSFTMVTNEQQTILSAPSLQSSASLPKIPLDHLLKPLQDVNGYLASALFDKNGDLLAHHNKSIDGVEMIGTHAAAIIINAIKATHSSESGKFEFIEITIDDGLHALWGVANQYLTAVLLDSDRRAGAGFAKVALEIVGENANRLSCNNPHHHD